MRRSAAPTRRWRRWRRRAEGATLYVTLEPCTHTGKTPPCTPAVIAAGVRRVVVGCRDPDPRAGGGVEALRRAGLEVTVGVSAMDVTGTQIDRGH